MYGAVAAVLAEQEAFSPEKNTQEVLTSVLSSDSLWKESW